MIRSSRTSQLETTCIGRADPTDPRKLFADERYAALCVFCGRLPSTREHAASLVLLDDPLPDDLPIIGSCEDCNKGFSLDEEYLACLIDCVISGSTDPDSAKRRKVRQALVHSPAFGARIEAGRKQDRSGNTVWMPEEERIRNVIVKLAQGHVAHRYSEPRLDEPAGVAVQPLATLPDEQRKAFEKAPANRAWPEIGCRAFVEMVVHEGQIYDLGEGWDTLQAGRYRYLVAQPGETVFRLVLSEYLAAEVIWQ